jgi:hypothetical protein
VESRRFALFANTLDYPIKGYTTFDEEVFAFSVKMPWHDVTRPLRYWVKQPNVIGGRGRGMRKEGVGGTRGSISESQRSANS